MVAQVLASDLRETYSECTHCNGFGEHIVVDGLNDKSVCNECEGTGMATKKVAKKVKIKKVPRAPKASAPEIVIGFDMATGPDESSIVLVDTETGLIVSDIPEATRLRGRAPKLASPRARRILIRMSEAEYEDLESKSEALGMSKGHYMRDKAGLAR